MNFRSFSFSRRPSRSDPLKIVSTHLGQHDGLATLLPMARQILEIEKDCQNGFANLFPPCAVIRYGEHTLTLGAPNAAWATRLKQQLPRMIESLQEKGWQVNAIRVKLQVRPLAPPPRAEKNLNLSAHALSAFAALADTLARERSNPGLQDALARLLKRHGQTPR